MPKRRKKKVNKMHVEQNTPEWFEARMGIVTASQMHLLLGKGKKRPLTLTCERYLCDLVGERFTGVKEESFSTKHTQRGHELEPVLVDLYEAYSGNTVQPGGFHTRDFAGDKVGASPDGLVGNNRLLEMKTHKQGIQVHKIAFHDVEKEHMVQIQTGLWVLDREYYDYVTYCPSLPLYVKEYGRDDKMIAEIEAGVTRFYECLHEVMDKVKQYNFVL